MPGNVDRTCAATALTEGDRVIIGWWEDIAVREWLEQHARKYHKQLLGLSRAMARGGPATRTAQRAVLRSASGRICCFVHAATKRGKKFTRAEIDQRTLVLRPWVDCKEPVTAVHVNDEGKTRLTAKLGVSRLCLNYLVQNVLMVMSGFPEDEYNCAGRGAHRVVEEIMDCIRGGTSGFGLPWTGQADVKDCFPSFRQEGVSKRMRLPEAVVRNVVFLNEDVEIVSHKGTPVSISVRDTLRRGLPQGTPTSAIVASLLLADLTRPAALNVALFRYSDNIYWLAWSKAEVVATLNALKQSFGSTSAGELTLHKIWCGHADEGFKCLGYKVITDPKADTYVPRAYPRAEAFERHWDRLRNVLPSVEPHLRDDVAFQLTEEWRNSWKAWDPSAHMIDKVFAQAFKIAYGLNKLDVAALE